MEPHSTPLEVWTNCLSWPIIIFNWSTWLVGKKQILLCSEMRWRTFSENKFKFRKRERMSFPLSWKKIRKKDFLNYLMDFSNQLWIFSQKQTDTNTQTYEYTDKVIQTETLTYKYWLVQTYTNTETFKHNHKDTGIDAYRHHTHQTVHVSKYCSLRH